MVGVGTSTYPRRRFVRGEWAPKVNRPALAAVVREAGLVALLYALWIFAARLSVLGIDDAISRAEWIVGFQESLFLPSELTLQNWVRQSSFWTQAANLYYAGVHVPIMGVLLIWLFARHRDAYPAWRNTLALTTGASLLLQLIPVAPPRLTPSTGLVDTGLEYGQSLYAALGYDDAGQFQAMPSIHVAWAALIGWAVWRVSKSRWRWVGPAHLAITVLVVTVTGHHFWLDGIVACIVLVVARPLGVAIAGWSDRDTVEPEEPLPEAMSTIS